MGGGSGAGDEIRTRDIYLGKVVLYQLSYSRTGTAPRTVPSKQVHSANLVQYKKNPRADRLFRDPAVRVSLALLCFTTQFGMGWGGSTALWARGCLALRVVLNL